MGKTALLQKLESRLNAADQQQCERIAHSVIYHLWRRLPYDERQKLLDALPPDTAELLEGPETPDEPEMTSDQWERKGSIEYDYFAKFRAEVRRETQLEEGDDEEAIEAVFGALKSELPEVEVAHIQRMLPQGLKDTWAGA